MPRLTQLAELRTSLKAEIGASMTIGQADDPMFNRLLSNMQQWLAAEYDWPFLETRADVAMLPGTRSYVFPVNINTDRPISVEIKFNNYWQEVNFGIGSEEYNEVDSEQGRAQDPVQRWRYDDEGNIEVWPIPATAQTLRFTGQRVLDEMSADQDPCDLDDELVVLFCAAEYLSRHQEQDAQLKLQKAQARLIKLRANFASRTMTTILGQYKDRSERQNRRNVPMIVVHG